MTKRGKNVLIVLSVVGLGAVLTLGSVIWGTGNFYRSDQPEKAEILTPRPPKGPRINGPKVYGVRPGNPMSFTIAATGERPMTFSAVNLPKGLILDESRGRITGVLPEAGEFVVTLKAENAFGSVERNFRIIAGSTIALTPPMGWNSWNCWGQKVTQDQVLRAARAVVNTGLINHGWSTVNIDDGWQGVRGGPFQAIQPNAKFPSMKALVDEVHGLGLKVGIYSTPWLGSFAGHIGSSADNKEGTYWWIEDGDHSKNYRIGGKDKELNQHRFDKKSQRVFGQVSFVENDVKQWVEWEMDFLKYDWFPDVAHTEEIHTALSRQKRDIVLSISNTCDLRLAKDWARLANAWRTTGDIKDTWKSVSEIGFDQDKWASFAGPGHWNDPDMLVVGVVGWGDPCPTRLTPNEQYAHMSLWCLLAAPLILGCDLEKLDEFTLSLLTNDEVIAINQDPLGKQATKVGGQWATEVYAKPLEDGSWGVGLFNRGNRKAKVTCHWDDIRVTGRQVVRDLWRQKDLGVFDRRFETEVPPHGVVLVRVIPEAR